MDRSIDISNYQNAELNDWVIKSLKLFNGNKYLDKIQRIYPFSLARIRGLSPELLRQLEMDFNNRRTVSLLNKLVTLKKFPYEEPMWYLIRNVKDCRRNNPTQIQRIAQNLYSMGVDEFILRLQAPPKINTQMGPMFSNWIKTKFSALKRERFLSSTSGIHILDANEQEAKDFVNNDLSQHLQKRPDMVAKVNRQYIIGEAKWIGQPGGNQYKQVREVITFCQNQRGDVRRVGIIDGFPWAIRNVSNAIINNKENILVQEATFDVFSALLLPKYLASYR